MLFSPSWLEALLQGWRQQLVSWAQSGQISRAATDALQLAEEPDLLQLLVGRWASNNFVDLPGFELLPAASMPGASGAYALSNGTIYLNADWLQRATREQALAVLTEELGHHLDGQLNGADTPGDEGALFAALLLGGGALGEAERQVLLAEDDRGRVFVAGRELEVEQAARVVSTPIPVAAPGRTGGEVRNLYAFAALKADGSVVTWGRSFSGGDSSGVADQLSSGVEQIFSTYTAFAALKSDGSVVTWGDPKAATGGNWVYVAYQLRSGVKQIFSTYYAFAALKSDGSAVIWGDWSYGGYSNNVASLLSSGVKQIFSNGHAFAALKSDGSVVTWGNNTYGGNSSGVASQLRSGVRQIFSTDKAFAALKSDGSVVTWGIDWGGGNGPIRQLSSGVKKIFSNERAFAALKTDGSVVTWGGDDSSGVADRLSSGVKQIFSTTNAFAALKADGSVVTWGSSNSGGDSNLVVSKLRSGVEHIFSNGSAFAALKKDGSVVTWGSSSAGGDSSVEESRLRSGVKHIFSNRSAFAALKTDGSVVTWGDDRGGGYSWPVARQLSSGVEQIFSTERAFAALKNDGSVFAWGDELYGSNVGGQLTNVVAFANPFTDDRLITSETLPTTGSTYSIKRLDSDGDEGHRHTFRINRTGDVSTAGAVRFTTKSDTAISDSDFLRFARKIKFKPGQRKKNVYVDSLADLLTENKERFKATISKVRAKDTIRKESVFGFIHDNPPPKSDNPVEEVVLSKDNNIDGLLADYRWVAKPGDSKLVLAFGFPSSINDYKENYKDRQQYETSFKGFNAEQKKIARAWLFRDASSYSNIAKISFVEEKSGRDATIRWAMSNHHPEKEDAKNEAHAHYPYPEGAAVGDVWLNTQSYNNPQIGTKAFFAFGHELGHALGLKHPHEKEPHKNWAKTVKMPADRDAIEFTIMSARSYSRAEISYRNESESYPQSLMMQDIAALQYLYGANFEGDDSRYTFSPQTGEMLINGKGQGKPKENRIFRTIWDGGGQDVYDFSNYSRNLIIDLNPGGWSDLDSGGNRQKAILQEEGNGGVKYAGGHVYNALEYNNDPRSLIESAIGGSKHDKIAGNRIGNDIFGNEGNDEINGKGGRDFLEGVLSNEILPGRGEKDILTGGPGRDTFSLGNAEKFFYSDGNPFASGRKDYALITDFAAGDKIQLFGQAADYHLKRNDSVGSAAATGFGLYRNDGFGFGTTVGLDASDEFIALIQAGEGINLSLTDSSQFTYLS